MVLLFLRMVQNKYTIKHKNTIPCFVNIVKINIAYLCVFIREIHIISVFNSDYYCGIISAVKIFKRINQTLLCILSRKDAI